MENLVVTLEPAKKLKAAGFPQASYCSWVEVEPALKDWQLLVSHEGYSEFLAAPTAQEIADQLPENFDTYKDRGVYWAQITTDVDGYAESTSGDWCSTMAEALAALWLELQSVGSTKVSKQENE
jgi:hypothetical protein